MKGREGELTEEHGIGVSMAQAGADFASSQYQLWHANDAGRVCRAVDVDTS